jgi:hypothetical protein
MAKLFSCDGSDEAVEGTELALAAEVEALEHVVPKCRHLPILASQKFLERSSGVGVLAPGRRQIDLQLIDT